MRDKKKTRYTLMFLIFAAIFLYSAYTLTVYYVNAYRASREFGSLRDLTGEATPRPTPDEIFIPAPTPISWEIMPRFTELYELNGEFVGWLKIYDTKIDYPVMQSSADDPFFYLHSNFNRSDDNNGTPFLDAQCSIRPNSGNCIIYGHNMRSGLMFHDLTKYIEKDFWDSHKYVLFDTLYSEGTYQIFAAFVFDVSKMTEDSFRFFRPVDFSDEAEFEAFIAEIKNRALYDTGITPAFGDELLTLSTCEYTTADGRFVVMAKRIA